MEQLTTSGANAKTRHLRLVNEMRNSLPGPKDSCARDKQFPAEVASKIAYALEVRLTNVMHLGVGLAVLMHEGEKFATEVNETFANSATFRSLQMHILWNQTDKGEITSYVPHIGWCEKISHTDLQGFELVKPVKAVALEFQFEQRREFDPFSMR